MLRRRSQRGLQGFLPGELVILMALVAPPHSKGQVVDPATAAQEPVPGAGHHYIGIGAETVNPADGSVSFNLPIQTPTGRGLTLPFGINYNSSEPFYLTNNGTGPYFQWATPELNNRPGPFEVDGWSYSLPTYEAQAAVASTVTSTQSSPPDYWVYDYCFATENYSFRGLDGNRYPLDVYNRFPKNDNPDANACASNGVGSVNNPALYGVSATLAAGGTMVQPALTVTDRNGTVYSFPSSPNIAYQLDTPIPFGALAQSITDRNGNEVVLNGTSNYSSGQTIGAGSYTDTLGRNPVLSWTGMNSPSGDQIAVSGLPSPIIVKWEKITVSLPTNSQFVFATSGGSCGFGNSGPITVSAVSEIDLPNGQNYRFEYGGTWGLINKIYFPNGGYVRYEWGTNPASLATYQSWQLNAPNTSGGADCSAIVDTAAISDRWVSYDGSTELLHQQFKYPSQGTTWGTAVNGVPYWTSKTTTVTSTDLKTGQVTNTAYSYSAIPAAAVANVIGPDWNQNSVPVEHTVVYQDGSGSTIQTVNKTWADQYAMVGSQTILDNGQGITTLRCVDPSDRVLGVYEYNFQSAGGKPADPSCRWAPSGASTLSAGLNAATIGPLLRQTLTAYHNFGVGSNILDEPDSVTVLDGSGNRLSQASYVYDGSAVYPSGAQAGLITPSGPRGNATSVSHWLNTSNSSLTTTYTYFDTGQVQVMTAPCGITSCADIVTGNHTTTFSYADAFAPGTGVPSQQLQTNAYLTKVTDPLGHNNSYTWGYADGLVRSHNDQNSQPYSYQYNDPLLRLKQVQGPQDPNNGGQSPATSYSYSDWTPGDPIPSSIVKSELENASGEQISSTSTLDGMGHTTHLQSTDMSGAFVVDTVYGGLGWVYTVSNPYRSTSDDTYGLTTTAYDALGRKISQIDSDGVSTQTWSYNGNTVTYTDENGNQWKRTTDALGRLFQVLEPNGTSQAATLETDYTYDLLNNLTSVTQCGGSCPSASSVSRSFTYDSLGRLVQSFNPESGWTCYGTSGGSTPNGANCQSGYDANGNLAYKTDARGVVAAYTYDSLNRTLSKQFTGDPTGTPSVCYQYDSSSVPLSIGRLTAEWTQSPAQGSCKSTPPTSGMWSEKAILAYDPEGHVLNEQQCTPSNCTASTGYKPVYTYDLAGNVVTSTNGIMSTPSVNTLTFTNSFDTAGRLQTVKSSWSDTTHPATLFSAQTGPTLPCTSASTPYAAFGGLMNATLGSGLSINHGYDKRLRTTCDVDTGGTVVSATGGSATVSITGAEQSK